jgi:MYXO-CTERM domain-containing protein
MIERKSPVAGTAAARGAGAALCLGCFVALGNAGCSASAGTGELSVGSVAEAVTGPFMWKGFTWQPTTGGMAGVAQGDPANIVVDANGYVHLKITKSAGGTWTASEMFTSTSLGFGTYQWQISGPIDRMDHTVVLGLFPYGPQAGIGADGTNEIDTEFSFWNDELTNVNADWGVYPPSTAAMHWEDDYMFSLSGGSAATTRMEWNRTHIKFTLMSGFQPLGSTQGLLGTYDYVAANPTADIPQQALPLGMNLWCYKAVPSSGQNVEIVIQDFQFVPEGQPIPDAGGPSPDAGNDATPAPDAGAGGDDGGPDAASPGDAAEDTGQPSPGPDAGTPMPGTPDAGEEAGQGEAGPGPGAADDAPSGGNGAGAMDNSSSGCSCDAAGTQTDRSAAFAVGAVLAFVLSQRRRSSCRAAGIGSHRA